MPLHIVVATDISDLKTDYYRQLLDSFQDCVKVVDAKGRLIFVNPAGRKVLSLGPTEPLGMLWTDLLPAGATHKVQQILEQVLSGEAAQFSNHSQFPNSEPQTWQHVLTPYRDIEGRVVAALCISRNISHDYDAHRASRSNEARLATAIKAGRLGIWDLNLNNFRLNCDDMWYEIMGLDKEDAIISVDQFLRYVHPDDFDRLNSDWMARDTFINGAGHYASSFRIIDAEGKTRKIHAAASVVCDLTDNPIRAIGLMSEINFSEN